MKGGRTGGNPTRPLLGKIVRFILELCTIRFCDYRLSPIPLQVQCFWCNKTLIRNRFSDFLSLKSASR